MELRFVPLRIGNAENTLGSRCDGPIHTSRHRFLAFYAGGIVDGVALCRMFHRAIRGHRLPKYLSRIMIRSIDSTKWQVNLRVLEVAEIKTIPYAPLSHPFVERLIGTVRRRASTSTGLYSGPQPIWRRSCSIFEIIITAIERMRDWTDACQNRLLTDQHR